MLDIISVGAATIDIFASSESIRQTDNNIVLPHSTKTEISQGLIASGGGATNSSVSFSRLGLNSACVSLVGTDPLSHYIENDLVYEKVQPLLFKNGLTDYSIILIAPDGGRTILTNRGPTCLEADNIKWDNLTNAKWFYITSLEGNFNLLEQLIGFAKEKNIKVALNPGSRELHQSKLLIPLIKHIEFLLLNLEESELITQKKFNEPGFWQKLESFEAKTTAVTAGRDGAYVFNDTKRLFAPIINHHPVDETGAGDSFGSAFIASQVHGFDLHTSLSWGMKNSASVVSFLGAKPGLLSLNQIK